MIHRLELLPAVVLLMATGLSAGREWRSADGKRTIEAAFIGVQGDAVLVRSKDVNSAIPLTTLAPEDREFAKNAQLIADAAAKWGPQTFEVNLVTESGWLCRLALAGAAGGPVLFSGEQFFLVAADPSKGKQGDRFTGQLLYGAGGRTYHPIKGDPAPIRAFALSAEEATRVWMETVAKSNGDPAKQSPPVMEPEIALITMRGLGIVVGKSGFVAVDPAMLKDMTSIVVHHKGDHLPARLVAQDDALGVGVLSCDLPVEPARIGSKKQAALGQNVFAVNVELASTKKTLAGSPTMTRGIVSQIANGKSGAFQHDATITPESVGGFILGDKGDVLGVFFKTQAVGRAITAKKDQPVPRPPEGLGRSVSTSSLSAFLDKVPGAGSLKTSSGGDMEKLTKELTASVVLVVSTQEVKKPRAPAAAATTTSGSAGGPVTGWSLSKSGTRHSAKCRFYDATKSCTATEGTPCKICGG